MYFTISFYIVNQKPVIPGTDFHCDLNGLHVLLGEIQQCICVFCDSVFTSQMALSFNMNI